MLLKGIWDHSGRSVRSWKTGPSGDTLVSLVSCQMNTLEKEDTFETSRLVQTFSCIDILSVAFA